jgi:hypothetical protein
MTEMNVKHSQQTAAAAPPPGTQLAMLLPVQVELSNKSTKAARQLAWL